MSLCILITNVFVREVSIYLRSCDARMAEQFLYMPETRAAVQKVDVRDEQQMATLQQVFKWRNRGVSFSQIAAKLQHAGVFYVRHNEQRTWSESRCRRGFETYLKLRQAEKNSAELAAANR